MIDYVAQARRQAYIERLYERAGRSCGTYSGLLMEHIQHLLEQDMAEVLATTETTTPTTTETTDE